MWNIPVKNLGFNKERVDGKMDIYHILGKPKSKKQSNIIHFKTHSFTAAAYEKQKNIKNKKLKVKLSLTKKHKTSHMVTT